MSLHAFLGRVAGRLCIAAALAFGAAALPVVDGAMAPALAQAKKITAEFRLALEPYGRWQRHRRWGEVWIPTRIERDWRPYTVGRWVYTDEWGWYWVTDEPEAAWGVIVYHYGRWVLDPDFGWVWVPDTTWGPAWVSWRRGERHFGWAPLPPDPVVVDYYDEPDVWVFVRVTDFTAPRVTRVLLPPRERPVVLRETVVVNRTVIVRDRGPRIAVNPGIAPTIVAAAIGAPLRAYAVRPHVLAGTVRLPNAIELRAADIRQARRERVRVSLEETQTRFEPAREVPPPRPLAAGEAGRLGDNPPRAATGLAPRERDAEPREREQRETRPGPGRLPGAQQRETREPAQRPQREQRETQPGPGRLPGAQPRETREPSPPPAARQPQRETREPAQRPQREQREQRETQPGPGRLPGAQPRETREPSPPPAAREPQRETREPVQRPQREQREQRETQPAPGRLPGAQPRETREPSPPAAVVRPPREPGERPAAPPARTEGRAPIAPQPPIMRERPERGPAVQERGEPGGRGGGPAARGKPGDGPEGPGKGRGRDRD